FVLLGIKYKAVEDKHRDSKDNALEMLAFVCAMVPIKIAMTIGSQIHSWIIIKQSYCKLNKKATGVKPSLEEVYTKCHTKKDKSWIDERSEKVI
ncbi:hypothetical protein S245_069535, partial [Arachis hypogaea]